MPDSSDRWQRCHLAHRTIDDMTIVVHARDGHVVTLDDIGSVLWDQLSAPSSVAELEQRIRDEFDVKKDEDVSTDVREFIDRLSDLNLLESCP